MSLRDNIRSREEVLDSDFITIAELSLFKSMSDYKEQCLKREKAQLKKECKRYDILDI